MVEVLHAVGEIVEDAPGVIADLRLVEAELDLVIGKRDLPKNLPLCELLGGCGLRVGLVSARLGRIGLRIQTADLDPRLVVDFLDPALVLLYAALHGVDLLILLLDRLPEHLLRYTARGENERDAQ